MGTTLGWQVGMSRDAGLCHGPDMEQKLDASLPWKCRLRNFIICVGNGRHAFHYAGAQSLAEYLFVPKII